MNYIFLNLKRFDVPKTLGGISTDNDATAWGSNIISGIDDGVKAYQDTTFASFLPEAHIIGAAKAKSKDSVMEIGSQSVHWGDVKTGENIGAFTSGRTAKSMKALGCEWTIIGHCEERRDLNHILSTGGCGGQSAVSRILNGKVKAAQSGGLNVLYCVGETEDEQPNRYEVIKQQITDGLQGVDLSNVVIAYEPVWAIGPGKTPPDDAYIRNIAQFIKKQVSVPVVYGGGLKQDNAEMLASIKEIDGGLIALTRFTGDVGFYPDEYLEIVDIYLTSKKG